ncbi:MAG: EF-P lysine aminoacylase EpmA [Gammaproteobacteria bacterium]
MHWGPTASLETLQQRAALLTATREYFAETGALEVETPVLTDTAAPDPHIHCIRVEDKKWLRSSPEFHMKRVLAAYQTDIYEIGKVFRDKESGSLHRKEFTMLEWYRVNFGIEDIINETCHVISLLANTFGKSLEKPHVITYREAYQNSLGFDPFTATFQEIRSAADNHFAAEFLSDPGLEKRLGSERSTWLDFIFLKTSQSFPRDRLVVMRDFPADQAQLAELNDADPEIADRFEIFLNQVELANGYRELRNPDIQEERFKANNEARKNLGLEPHPDQTDLNDALRHGLPPCSGVSVGLDRLLMLINDEKKLSGIMTF